MKVTVGNIFDCSLIALAVIVLIIGLCRGFAKQFGKGFCGFVGMILATITCFIVMMYADGTKAVEPLSKWFDSFEKITASWFSGNNGFGNFIAGLSSIEGIAKAAEKFGSVGALFGNITAHVIIDIALWIVAYLVFKYLLWGISALLRLLAKVPVFKTIDRIFGGMWAVAITYAVVIVVLYSVVVAVCVKHSTDGGFLANMLKVIKDGVEHSTVFKAVHDYNFAGLALSQKIFGVDIINFTVIGK